MLKPPVPLATLAATLVLAAACGPSVKPGASSFDVGVNGLSFANYTNRGVTNLTATELRRLFGDRVCAASAAGGCTLTPAASKWMRHANEVMNGGHCLGISHFALALFSGRLDASAFGGTGAHELSKSNELVQREIAYWMAMQFTSPANQRARQAAPTPTQALAQLVDGWARGEFSTVAFYRQGGGGHAVTPIAVTVGPAQTAALAIYDNNYPGTVRSIAFDLARDSWSFQASTRPDAPNSDYGGDAKSGNLMLIPLADALGPQTCGFCGDHDPAEATAGERLISSIGEDDVLIDDGAGHTIGTRGTELVHRFPGAHAHAPFSDLFGEDTEPRYTVPGGSELAITLHGAHRGAASPSELSVVGPGYTLAVEGIVLDPGQRDRLTVSADGETVTYRGAAGETPTVHSGFSTPGHDYGLSVHVDAGGDGAEFTIDRTALGVKVHFKDVGATRFGLTITRVHDSVDETFTHDGAALAGDATLHFDLGQWPGQGQPLAVAIDLGSDGSIDERVQLADQR